MRSLVALLVLDLARSSFLETINLRSVDIDADIYPITNASKAYTWKKFIK